MKISLLMKLSLVLAILALTLLIGTNALANSYNYITPEELKARIDRGDIEQGNMTMFSTQTDKEYATGYLPTAIPTFARPLESEADYRRLDPVLAHIKGSDNDIIIVCPRGGSGATKPFDYFKQQGINTDRMLILKGGQEAYNKVFPQDVRKAGR